MPKKKKRIKQIISKKVLSGITRLKRLRRNPKIENVKQTEKRLQSVSLDSFLYFIL